MDKARNSLNKLVIQGTESGIELFLDGNRLDHVFSFHLDADEDTIGHACLTVEMAVELRDSTRKARNCRCAYRH